MQSVIDFVQSGGFVMYPLLICSILIWTIIIERLWKFRNLSKDLKAFHVEAIQALVGEDEAAVEKLCKEHPFLPTSKVLQSALERMNSQNKTLKKKWHEALDRRRQLENQELKRGLWVLGTIGSAAPFIGLFGTVIGILQSFQEIARTGKGGFAIVASGISEALIATAAGIVVAVIAVMAFNAFQTKWASLVLTIKVHAEEFAEMLQTKVAEER